MAMMEALMAREETLIRLMNEHQADVWRYLRFLGAGRSLSDDLTQEVFVYVYRRPITEISRPQTAAYLRKCARNRYLNWRRREGREVSMDALAAAETSWVTLTPDGGDERLIALERCLEKLGDRARHAVDLKYARTLSEAEVATRMNTTPEAAKALLKRARAQLRKCVERKLKP